MPTYAQNPYTQGVDAGTKMFDGNVLTFVESALSHPTHADGFVDDGDPVIVGGLRGIATRSAAAATDYIPVDRKGIYSLTVLGTNQFGNSAVAVGDFVYISTTCVLSKDSTGALFGIALGTVVSGETTTVIPVLLSDTTKRSGLDVGLTQTVTMSDLVAADVAKVMFVAPAACTLVAAIETHGTVAGQAGTLTIEKCNTGEAAAAGDVMLTGTWDLTSTINVPVALPAVADGKQIMVAGDMVRLKLASGAATSLAGMSIALLVRMETGDLHMVTMSDLVAADVAKVMFTAPASCKLVSAIETHGTVAGQAGTLTLEKCNSGEAAAAGDVMLAAAWDLTSTINTPVSKAAVADGKETLIAGDMVRLKVASGAATSLAGMSITLLLQWR